VISFSKRAEEEEIMDDLQCHGEVVNQTLRELDFINRWLGGNQVTLSALKKLWLSIPSKKEITIVDLGCGSGEMLRMIASLAAKEKRRVILIGIDANENIIEYARNHSLNFKNISFQSINVFSTEFQLLKFDIVLATLFFHHFSHAQLVQLFSSLRKQAITGIIVNDIHRHPLAYYSIKWLTAVFSKSKMVKFDAPLSVRRAFHKKDLKEILKEAKIQKYDLRWRWAFRWRLLIFSDGD
jgi:2-polyprenyl-3-methyl-5-hydroxy-6-metoxy-1,4-benzoquinol methylase